MKTYVFPVLLLLFFSSILNAQRGSHSLCGSRNGSIHPLIDHPNVTVSPPNAYIYNVGDDSSIFIDGLDFPGVTTFFLTSRAYKSLTFINLQGTATCPITIKPIRGFRVRITGELSSAQTGQNSFTLRDCQYVEVDGRNSVIDRADIIIEDAPLHRQSLFIGGSSSNIDIHHLEISNYTGFAGIMVKNSPATSGNPGRNVTCASGYDCRDDFYMHDISIHDNFIHDVLNGEGIYAGDTGFWGVVCDNDGNASTTHDRIMVYPQHVENFNIFNNIVIRTGLDAIQLGSATFGSSIYGNYCADFGLRNHRAQSNGIQLGEGTQGVACYANYISHGSIGLDDNNRETLPLTNGNGILCIGAGDNCIYNNIIVNAKESGVFINERKSFRTPMGGNSPCYNAIDLGATPSSFLHNTIVYPEKEAFKLNGQYSFTGNVIENNLSIFRGVGAEFAFYLGRLGCQAQNQNLMLEYITDLSQVFYNTKVPALNGQPMSYMPRSSAIIDATASVCAGNSGCEILVDSYGNPRTWNFKSDFGAVESQSAVTQSLMSNPSNIIHNSGKFYDLVGIDSGFDADVIQENNAGLATESIVSPNPFSDRAMLSISSDMLSTGSCSVEIFTLNGQLIWSDQVNGAAQAGYAIPAHACAGQGVYILRLTSIPNGQQETLRIVKIG